MKKDIWYLTGAILGVAVIIKAILSGIAARAASVNINITDGRGVSFRFLLDFKKSHIPPEFFQGIIGIPVV